MGNWTPGGLPGRGTLEAKPGPQHGIIAAVTRPVTGIWWENATYPVGERDCSTVCVLPALEQQRA